MKLAYELDLNRFEAWSGAVSTLDRIREEGLCQQLEFILENLFPNGMTETELNDLLWFDSDWVYETLGIIKSPLGWHMKDPCCHLTGQHRILYGKFFGCSARW